MLTLPPSVRVFIAAEPVDMRGSFDALAGAVRRLGLDPLDGHLHVFLSKNRRLAKVIYFDRSGWCIFAKRLERGTFQLPSPEVLAGQTRVQIDAATLAAFLQGLDLRAPRRKWYQRKMGAEKLA
jgi:transposase